MSGAYAGRSGRSVQCGSRPTLRRHAFYDRNEGKTPPSTVTHNSQTEIANAEGSANLETMGMKT